jgi:periplasmic divalent cation tolerance protein
MEKPGMQECIQVTTTIDTQEGAQKIAEAVVKRRLAACVHVSGPITSTYWWQGKMEVATEWTCIAKTRKELYSELEQAIREAHSYDEPEIVALPIVDGSQSYLAWIVNETTKK